MDRVRWQQVYDLLLKLETHEFRGLYTAAAILAVYFWAVIHDRPVCWACEAVNWPEQMRLWPLPSQATMSRRMRHSDVQWLLEAISQELAVPVEDESLVKVVDGKPLPVGGATKDPDARWGRAASSGGKGYKLFAIWGRGPVPIAWRVAPMSTSEENMAAEMLPELSGSGGYVLGDKLYDSNRLHDIAGASGHQLIAAKRCGKGLGHHRHSPYRLRSLELLQTKFGRDLYRMRPSIERQFGNLTNFGGGLSPLPSWVRRLRRVRQWVHAKIIIRALKHAQNWASTVMPAVA